MTSLRTATLTYRYAAWGDIVEHLREVDLDADDPDAPAHPLILARLIEREAALWDDAEYPQTIAMTPEQKEQIERVAQALGIEEVKLPQP